MSFDIKHRANRTIAQGSLTNSKHPDRFPSNVPTHIKWGKGCFLYDFEDREWIDLISGLGANHFGYGCEKIQSEVIKHALHGDCHSLPTHHEIECAEKVQELFPFVEKVKFTNDGSSACTAACIIARAATGRKKILTEGYHGWHPEQISPVAFEPNGNIYNIRKIREFDEIDSETAAVILEPVQIDNSRGRIAWLKKLRDRCTEKGAVLIFDEVITGIRYPKFGVSNCYGIHPDLLLLGKAMANGHKLAAVCGKKDLMDGKYFVSGTYHGQIAPLVAAKKAMDLAKHDQTYDNKKLNDDSLLFFQRLSAQADGLECRFIGWGCRGSAGGDHFPIFQQEMARMKILIGPSIFINFESQKILDDILHYAEMAFEKIRSGAKLEGPAPTPAFSQRSRS